MKVIAVYHNKGGVGKTTTVVNLGAAIRKNRKKVLVIDLDSQANATFATGLVKFHDEAFDDIKECNILHVLQSEEFFSISEVARKSEFSNPEIDVVPAHIDLMKYELDMNQLDFSLLMLMDKLEDVKTYYDVVIIDTPPSWNLYARIALITADYLIIPSDLKPFSNQGLLNVKDFIRAINGYRKQVKIKPPLKVLGVLPCKIATNNMFIQHTLPKRIKAISERYGFDVMKSVIFDRDDLAKCAEQVEKVDNQDIPYPVSVLDYKPYSMASEEFRSLAQEVLEKIGM
ncbi:MAG: ParA family protein [Moorea sp. SIO3I7]|uniref:ParA family protein n=1 Tax=Moorena sp. SIO3I8 TaxID=2607833 RepID=UPI0013C1C3AB|nr:AAA family ATPase [Moorena sp. SIO3I8]NEN95692.1 ParA family protein [Moorena sp. SIO3I7]NEO07975.1 ParA family protein [Moorena sp. SIO3I8]